MKSFWFNSSRFACTVLPFKALRIDSTLAILSLSWGRSCFFCSSAVFFSISSFCSIHTKWFISSSCVWSDLLCKRYPSLFIKPNMWVYKRYPFTSMGNFVSGVRPYGFSIGCFAYNITNFFHLWCMLQGSVWIRLKSNLFRLSEGETFIDTSWHAKMSLTLTPPI